MRNDERGKSALPDEALESVSGGQTDEAWPMEDLNVPLHVVIPVPPPQVDLPLPSPSD